MKEELEFMRNSLANYKGKELRIMEICGSHTAAITRSGIRSIISPKIKLISGPGCPVCVTPSAYIDRLIEFAEKENVCVVTFGDMLRVPGSVKSLSAARGEGADVRMVYSPIDIINFAEKEPEKQFVFAAVGFETTTPVYADLIEELIERKIENVKLLTALKTMPQAVELLASGAYGDNYCLDKLAERTPAVIDGFLAPGHVCSVAGSEIFEPMAKKYSLPFVVAGFESSELLAAIYGIITHIGRGGVFNYYSRAVTEHGNVKAMAQVKKYFEPCDAVWRGLGNIPDSGLKIKEAYRAFDAGSEGLTADIKMNEGCCCGEILVGRKTPSECPLFGTKCTPLSPQGACMVSDEGSCRHSYPYRKN